MINVNILLGFIAFMFRLIRRNFGNGKKSVEAARRRRYVMDSMFRRFKELACHAR